MTVFGWDASHYDGYLSLDILRAAKREGIEFFTHKIGEGLSDTEGIGDDTALSAARDAGIELLGGYLVVRTGIPVPTQVDYWLSLADAGEPWWRSHPGWFWQVDLERWPYDNVPAWAGVQAAKQLRARTNRFVILYASHSQYGNDLVEWDGPIWNADYVSRPPGSVTSMYPGDDWTPLHGGWSGGWSEFSGKEPTILQFTSSATIAGLTTCDANAFRGTIDDLRALITGGSDMVSDAQWNELMRLVANLEGMVSHFFRDWDDIPIGVYSDGNFIEPPNGDVPNMVKQRLTAVSTVVEKLATAGVNADELAAKVKALLPPPPSAAEIATEIIAQLSKPK